MDPVQRLRELLNQRSAAGQATCLGEAGELAWRGSGWTASLRTLGLEPESQRSNVSLGLRSVHCGPMEGLLAVLASGGPKDYRGFVAAGQAIVDVLDAFEAPLLATADVAPTLRRAVLNAHDAIWALSHQKTRDPRASHPVVANRGAGSLRGIGAELAIALALEDTLWGTWVGAVELLLLQGGRLRRLNLPHTLVNERGYSSLGVEREDYHRFVVLRVLGLAERAPDFEVTRLDLATNDRVLLGTSDLTDALAGWDPTTAPQSSGDLGRGLLRRFDPSSSEFAASVGLLERGRRRSDRAGELPRS